MNFILQLQVFYVNHHHLHRAGYAVRFFLFFFLTAPVGVVFGQQNGAGDFSVIAPLAARSLLLDGAIINGKAVVVGERGHVLVSGNGNDWKQVVVPTRSTLTGVFFINEKLGWAVGHDAVILRTADGGIHWEKVYYAPDNETPLLDIRFLDENNGIAIGAYGFYLTSHDSGRTWHAEELNISKPEIPDHTESADDTDADEFTDEYQLHLNNIASSDSGRLYIAAEAGRIYRSDNAGKSWMEMPSPYMGSFFGVLPLTGETVLVYGLRGHLYRSDDEGLTWLKIETGTSEMLTDGIMLSDGRIVIAGLGGVLLVSHDQGISFSLLQQSNRSGFAAVMEESAANLLTVGDGGIGHIKLNEGN